MDVLCVAASRVQGLTRVQLVALRYVQFCGAVSQVGEEMVAVPAYAQAGPRQGGNARETPQGPVPPAVLGQLMLSSSASNAVQWDLDCRSCKTVEAARV